MTEVEFDPEKSARNERERGISFLLAATVFLGEFVEWVDDRIDYGEVRWRAVGGVPSLGDSLALVVYTWRGHRRRIISARKANRNEQGRYYRRYG